MIIYKLSYLMIFIAELALSVESCIFSEHMRLCTEVTCVKARRYERLDEPALQPAGPVQCEAM